MTAVAIADDRLRVHFDRFDLDSYQLFLKAKSLPEYEVEFHREGETYTITAPARFAGMLGVELPTDRAKDLGLSPFLFDDQQAIVRMALDAKRFACWSDCGLGKTLVGLEWARHVMHRTKDGRVLVVTMNEIVPQWIAEAARFYGDSLPILRLQSREDMKYWCRWGTTPDTKGPASLAIGVVNYEKWNPPSLAEQVVSEAKYLAGIILDESSRLKTGGGKQKWALIKSCRGIEYKLSLTATPAPNDVMEFASQASFLEKMRSEGEILWTYFTRDNTTHRWTVKPHARAAFFQFMAGWSIYVRDPRRYGWRKDFPEVPQPVTILRPIEPTAEQLAYEAELDGAAVQESRPKGRNFVVAGRLSQIAKGFRYRFGKGAAGPFDRIPSHKPSVVAEDVAAEVKGGAQVLVWTVFDAESQLIAEELEKAGLSFAVLTGKTAKKKRADILDQFRAGEVRVLVSRPSMLGWGMNLQFVGAHVFSGFTYSYEQDYQAKRRTYRFGKTESLRVYVPFVRGLEEDMLDALGRKQAEHEASIDEMERNYITAFRGLGGTT